MPKKEEIIYKRKDNCWEVRHGYCKTKGKAEYAKTDLIMYEISTQLHRKKFSHYCDEWLRLNKIRIKESTYVKYNTTIEKRIKPNKKMPFEHLFSSNISIFLRTQTDTIADCLQYTHTTEKIYFFGRGESIINNKKVA